jgi:hypothetical protein
MDYINSIRPPLDNWFYFINNYHGIFSSLKRMGLYEPTMVNYDNMKDKSSKEDLYIELLKPIGIVVGNNTAIHDYISALMSVNFLKKIFFDSQTIGEILLKIATQTGDDDIIEKHYDGEIKSTNTIHVAIGPPYCGKYNYYYGDEQTYVSFTDKNMRYGFRKEHTKQFVEKNFYIKYYLFWRDYEDCFSDFVDKTINTPKTIARKMFNDELLKFRFPRKNEIYHSFEHIII